MKLLALPRSLFLICRNVKTNLYGAHACIGTAWSSQKARNMIPDDHWFKQRLITSVTTSKAVMNYYDGNPAISAGRKIDRNICKGLIFKRLHIQHFILFCDMITESTDWSDAHQVAVSSCSGSWESLAEDDPLIAGRYDHAKAVVPSVIAAAIEPQIHFRLLFLICLLRLAISANLEARKLEEQESSNT